MAIFEVIKKTRNDDNIIWHYPKRNFNTGSKLIVNESEEALFYLTGKALDLFGPGKHVLSTNNIPLLRGIIDISTGWKTPFTCDVYFVDKTIQKYKWGTSTKMEFLEPIYNFPISVGACGELRFQIEDSRKFIVKLIGIKKNFDTTNVDEFFASQMLVKVKTYLTNMIKDDKICIFEIDNQLERISKDMQEKLNDDFAEYGLKLQNFFVTNILKPEEDKQYLKFKELFFKRGVSVVEAEVNKKIEVIESEKEAAKVTIGAEAQASKRNIENYDYKQEKEYEIGKEVAKNEAVGQFTNIGVGLGVLSGVGSTMGEKVSNQVTGAFAKATEITCKKCGKLNLSDSKFCKFCGEQITANNIAYCSSCGLRIENDSLFCSKCGKKVDE